MESEVADTETARRYEQFARDEAPGRSELYGEFAAGVARDEDLLTRIDQLPIVKRQPNLLFAAVRAVTGLAASYDDFRQRFFSRTDQVLDIMRRRATQTNECARTAAILPVLGELDGPIALIEVGASAGLCLNPDKYRMTYRDVEGAALQSVGPEGSPVRLDCTVEGRPPLPKRMPNVVWRAGLDLNPLDVTDPDDVAWLQALVWPEQTERAERLKAAIEVARAEPPDLRRGDLTRDLNALLAEVPDGVLPVVFHTAVLAYVPDEERQKFVDERMSQKAVWISQEGQSVMPLPGGPTAYDSGKDRSRFLLAVNGEPIGLTEPHGGYLRWFAHTL
ncbi:DUF2332 domain-containing protein [Saxibacter everestensis]|uniref:DUF2332 domain-containing protein n=1 Tax=Saxibacter everestensis TaxID=2909229 RepID=A0ABY8QVM5_9MICO|nr:DUF2332 domain-containing protein [Brevibacteriaceae bacterium ZFBP1038]